MSTDAQKMQIESEYQEEYQKEVALNIFALQCDDSDTAVLLILDKKRQQNGVWDSLMQKRV